MPRPMPKAKPAFWHASAAFMKVSSVQFSALGGLPAGYIACTFDTGVLLHKVDARAGALDLAADRRRNRQPAVLRSPEVGDGPVHCAVLLDERLHNIVNTFQTVGVFVWRPSSHRQNVMPRFRLRFRGRGD